MPTQTPAQTENPNAFEALVARCGAKDRANLEKHLAICDAERTPAHARVWRRIAGKLSSLAPMPIQTAGPSVALFFIADGKYRMQVFALEDRNDGAILLFLPDVMDAAVKSKLVTKSGGQYATAGSTREPLSIEAMDATNTPDPPQHVKHMIGWKRKAIKLTLPTSDPDGAQVRVAEALCALAAKQWATA
jgi:hypothetical protein